MDTRWYSTRTRTRVQTGQVVAEARHVGGLHAQRQPVLHVGLLAVAHDVVGGDVVGAVRGGAHGPVLAQALRHEARRRTGRLCARRTR